MPALLNPHAFGSPPATPPGGYAWPFWLRASSLGLADGAAVNTWTDLGTGATDAVAGVAPGYKVSAIGGRPAVEFSGGQRLMSERGATTTPRTIIVVAQWAGFAGFKVPVGQCSTASTQQSGGRAFRPNAGGAMEILNAQIALYGTSSTALSTGTPYICTVTYSAANAWAMYVNGAAAGTGTGGGFSGPRETIIGAGSGDTGFNEFMLGYIAEVLEADAVLTGPELTAVHADLGAYYGITV